MCSVRFRRFIENKSPFFPTAHLFSLTITSNGPRARFAPGVLARAEPQPPGVWGQTWARFVWRIDAASTLVLLRGAFGPLMGHYALKIDKTAAYLTSELDL